MKRLEMMSEQHMEKLRELIRTQLKEYVVEHKQKPGDGRYSALLSEKRDR